MDDKNLVNVEVEPAVIGSEEETTVEENKRDYLKDGLAIGAGLLALDGLFHVGKFIGKKVVKPLWTKASNGIKNLKASHEANKANNKPETEKADDTAKE